MQAVFRRMLSQVEIWFLRGVSFDTADQLREAVKRLTRSPALQSDVGRAQIASREKQTLFARRAGTEQTKNREAGRPDTHKMNEREV
jgi:hypothetical protein